MGNACNGFIIWILLRFLRLNVSNENVENHDYLEFWLTTLLNVYYSVVMRWWCFACALPLFVYVFSFLLSSFPLVRRWNRETSDEEREKETILSLVLFHSSLHNATMHNVSRFLVFLGRQMIYACECVCQLIYSVPNSAWLHRISHDFSYYFFLLLLVLVVVGCCRCGLNKFQRTNMCCVLNSFDLNFRYELV